MAIVYVDKKPDPEARQKVEAAKRARLVLAQAEKGAAHLAKPAKPSKVKEKAAQSAGKRPVAAKSDAPAPTGPRKPKGRPRTPDSEKPWLALGISRSVFYRRKNKQNGDP